MDGELLGDIIDAEKEIQGFLESEETRARELVERVREEQASLLRRATEALEHEGEDLVREMRAGGEAEASRILEREQVEVDELLRLDDDTLRPIVVRHLTGILPGSGQ